MRKLLVQALRRDGREVVEAADGGRLLVRLAEAFDRDPTMATVDVLVSDVRTPVCSGLDLGERLFDAHWKVPCILITAFSDDAVRIRARAVGALLLDEPLRLEDLCDPVGRLAAH